jgi:hypothetical protein
VVGFLVLASCTSATEINGPNGQTFSLIECNGAVRTISSCYEKANEICPTGYIVLDTSEMPSSFVSVTQYGIIQGVERKIIVQCSNEKIATNLMDKK